MPGVAPRSAVRSSPATDTAGVIIIGASTGGPRAIGDLLNQLPVDFPVPCVIVQHLPAAGVDPDASSNIADRDAIDRAFKRLSPEHRVVLVLHHYLGFSDDEAAAAMAVPAGTVKSRLNRAKSALRSALEADARASGLAMESVR